MTVKFFAILITFYFNAFLEAAPRIKESVDQSSIFSNQFVTYSITISEEKNFSFKQPLFESNDSWTVEGPSVSQSTQNSWTNGQQKRQKQIQLQYRLSPKKTGTLDIPVLYIQIDNQRYRTQKMAIIVKQGQAPQNSQRQKRSQSPFGKLFGFDPFNEEDPFLDSNDPFFNNPLDDIIPEKAEIFLRAEPLKSKFYLGELIILPYNLYFKGQRLTATEYTSFPSFDSFLKEELFVSKRWEAKPSTYNGKEFLKAELIKYALYPLKTGLLSVDELKITTQAQMDPMQLFRNRGFGGIMNQSIKPQILSSGKILFEIVPLPTAPDNTNFSGAVGQFKIENSSATREVIRQGDSTEIKIRISGTGNLKSIPAPELDLPKHLKSFKVKKDYKLNNNGSGFVEFQYLLLAEEKGIVEIPSKTWSYFDPNQEKYINLKTPSFNIAISNGTQTTKQNNKKQLDLWSATASKNKINLKSKRFLGITFYLWGLLIISMTVIITLILIIKQKAQQVAFHKKNPWIKTKKKFLQQSEPSKKAKLLDQYIRQILCIKCMQSHENLNEQIEKICHKIAASSQYSGKESSQILEIWQQIDALRFSKVQKSEINKNYKLIFDKFNSIMKIKE